MNTTAMLDAFGSMTLDELTAFRTEFENRFNVTAAAPSAPVTAPGIEGDPGSAEDVAVTVTLTSAGTQKIQVIKVVRELVPGLGLKDAKELVDTVPSVVLDQVDQDKATAARDRLEQAGATVDLTHNGAEQ